MNLLEMKNAVKKDLDDGSSILIRDCFLDVDFVWFQFSYENKARQSKVLYDTDQTPYFEANNEKHYIYEFKPC